MVCTSRFDSSEPVNTWQQAQRVLELLASLSYRSTDLESYLHQIALGVSELVGFDWSIVTFCQDGLERVMASSIDLGEGEQVYRLHGLLTDTVVQTGQTLAVPDVTAHPEYGRAPEGYVSYLGIPLRTAFNEVLGTICSFCRQTRQFSPDEVRTVELFAERAATALDNYRLYQQQRQFNDRLEAEVINRTTELRSAQAQLIEQERLAAVGQFAAMIVHEVRNPMTTIRMGLNYFKKTRSTPAEQERLELALEEAARLDELLSEILLFAKPPVLQHQPIDFNELLTQVIAALQTIPELARHQIRCSLPPVAWVSGDRDKLKQVVINLIRNACEAVAEDEPITCTVAIGTLEPNSPGSDLPHPDGTGSARTSVGRAPEVFPAPEQLRFMVHNGGAVIPPEVLPKLLEPFYTTKSGGTGLGLAIVKRIVDAHNGTLTIASHEVEGTLVTVQLPLSPDNTE